MVSAYFVFTFLLLVLIYNISTGNNQFAATASLIRQIWSGRCRSCAQSTLSEFSVLSATVDINRASNQGGTSHNRNCVCDPCPCAMVENLLTKCSPIPQILQETINTIAQLIRSIYSVIENVYEDLARILQCGGTCQREPQALGMHDNISGESLSFTNKDAAKRQEISNEQGRKSNISFIIDAEESSKKGKNKNKKHQESNKKEESKKKSNHELNILERKKSKTNHDSQIMKFFKKKEKETKPESESSDDNVKPSGSYCTKCKQQNKSCSEDCPKAKQ